MDELRKRTIPLKTKAVKSAIIPLYGEVHRTLLLGALQTARETCQTQYKNAVKCKDTEMQIILDTRLMYFDSMLEFNVLDVDVAEVRNLIIKSMLSEVKPWPPETWQTDKEIEEYRNAFNEERAKYANASNEWWQLTKKNQPEPIKEDKPVKPSKAKSILKQTQTEKEMKDNSLTLKTLQDEHLKWSERNFGVMNADNGWMPVFGMMEELGELAHSLLKQAQNIRGNKEEHEQKAKDAIGDLVIFIASTCSAHGWDLQEIVQTTWNEVKQRDYKKDVNLIGSEN